MWNAIVSRCCSSQVGILQEFKGQAGFPTLLAYGPVPAAVFDPPVGDDEGIVRHCFVMEPHGQLLGEDTPSPEVLAVMLDVTGAIKALAEKGWLHR